MHMKRWVFILILCVATASLALGVFAAYAGYRLAYDAGRLHSSVEWTRSIAEIESQLLHDKAAVVGDWRLRVDRQRPRTVSVQWQGRREKQIAVPTQRQTKAEVRQ
jgi:hypothetical protein